MSLDILLTLAICGIALILLFLGVHIGLALAITGAIGIVLVTGTIQAGLGVLKTSRRHFRSSL